MVYLELKVAAIAISLSLHQQTASVENITMYIREKTAKFPNLSQGSDVWQIEQYETERTQSLDINQHRSLDVNHLEHYSIEDRTEKHSEFKLTGRK